MFDSKDLLGLQGEMMVREYLKEAQTKLPLGFIHNFPILRDDNKYTQCDFLVISTKGYTALEVKNWTCEIECSSDTPFWVVRYGNNLVRKRLNPILQNQAHVRWLHKTFNITARNLVAVSDAAVMKPYLPGMVYFSQLPEAISTGEDAFTEAQVHQLYAALTQIKAQNGVAALADMFVHQLKGGF